jgi:SAM-dependent methyltransferase
MRNIDRAHGGWEESAKAWIASQNELGDFSRREILDPALERIIGHVNGVHVLDVGCGEGRYARVLANRGAQVTGIDPVEEFIVWARERHHAGSYVLGSAEDLPFPDHSYDLVLSYLSLVDIVDYRRAIREMCRVAKRSGRIVLVTVSNFNVSPEGWVRDEQGRKLYRAVDDYMEERSMDLHWNGIHIRNYHRPLSAILGEFFQAGALMNGFFEPLPAPNSPVYEDERRAPCFQIMTFCF